MNYRWNYLLLVFLAAWCVQAASPVAGGVAHVRYLAGYWQLALVDQDGKNLRLLTDSPWDKRVVRSVPGESKVLFRDTSGKFYVFDIERGGEMTALLPDIEVVKDFDYDPAFGFLISTYAPNAKDNIRIWWFSPSGKEKRLVIPDPFLNEIPRWEPGGDSFVFVRAHAGKSAVYRTSLQSPEPKALLSIGVGSTTDPAPSPDGQNLAFCGEGQAGLDLWIARGDGSHPRVLYAGPGLEAEPCWSADGRFVYFSTWDKQDFRIAQIEPDGGGFAFVTPEGVDCRCPAYVELGGKAK